MMECKKALVATNGELDAAAEQLRVQGLAKADKKASRVAAEGTLVIERAGRRAVMVEVNCETDFVARREEISEFCAERRQGGARRNRHERRGHHATSGGRRRVRSRKRARDWSPRSERTSACVASPRGGADSARQLPARHAHRLPGRPAGRLGRARARRCDARCGDEPGVPDSRGRAGRHPGEGAGDIRRADEG